MQLGISLPNTLVPELNRGLFLDWARIADDAGFHTFGTIDQPDYDSWDPLTSLAAAAAVTERVRLATTILQLPNRNEVLVAKQAAVIDRLSGGRLTLGVGIGSRENDYKVFASRFANRGKKLERQLRKIRRVWRAARKATATEGVNGPAPLQKPLPPIWIGAQSEAGIRRAAELGDGYIFGVAGMAQAAQRVPQIRAMLDEKKAAKFTVAGIAYCAVGDDPVGALSAAAKTINRYYRGSPPRPIDQLVHHGPIEVIAQAMREYEEAGLDLVILIPAIPDTKQVSLIAEHVLPAYRVPATRR